MSISTAISSAVSGLSASQRELEVVAGNVANADTPGYARKIVGRSAEVAGGRTVGVNAEAISRQLDLQLQKQWQQSLAGGAYADTIADAWSRLDASYGGPGSPNALDTIFSSFTGALEQLSVSPEDHAARLGVVNAAQSIAGRLRNLSAEIQNLRNESESALASLASEANTLLDRIAKVDAQITAVNASGATNAALLDQRDLAIQGLSRILDIRVTESAGGGVVISTGGGATLYNGRVSKLEFDSRGVLNASAQWSADPAERGVGTLKLISPSGHASDLFAERGVRSGAIEAYRVLRDEVLTTAQAQLDELAHALALATSNVTKLGTPITDGPQAGFDLDLSALKPGNAVTLSYTTLPGGATQTVRFIRVDDPTVLPLPGSATPDPNDAVVGIDFSGGEAAAFAAMATALGANFDVTDEGGGVVRIMDAAGAVRVDALSASITITDLMGGVTALPMFADSRSGAAPYTGSFDGVGQKIGFAGRIIVNPALAGDPAGLIGYDVGVAAGDSARPDALLAALRSGIAPYAPETGIGSATAPFRGNIDGFIRQMTGVQGAAAADSQRLREGQEIVVNNLAERFDATRAVSIDQEMARLVQLQTAYQANARVLSVVQEMIDALLRV